MSRRRRMINGMAAALAMILLILDARCALEGGRQGLELCIRTVIPTLFPFFLLSAILAGSFTALPRSIVRIFKMPEGSGGILLAGLIGGYPIGAQVVSQAYTEGQIRKEDAQRILPICNQCGPAFLFGMTSALFTEKWIPWLLWGIQLLSVLITAWLIPGKPGAMYSIPNGRSLSLPEALQRALRSMASVCGWIVIFRVAIRFMERWILWLLPTAVRVSLFGILELANGVTELRQISDTNLRFVLCAMMMGFGGLCVTMQTYSVIDSSLKKTIYFPGKILQCALSVLLATAMMGNFSAITWICLAVGLLCVIFLRKKQKNSSTLTPAVV